MGLRESLKTNDNIIVLTECDGTFIANDIEKMIPYLDNCKWSSGLDKFRFYQREEIRIVCFMFWQLFSCQAYSNKIFQLVTSWHSTTDQCWLCL